MTDAGCAKREPLQLMSGTRLWWRTVRPVAYPASIIPALFGIVLAWSEEFSIRWGLAALTVVGVVAAHTASNLLSDFFDYRSGLDRPGTHGGSGVLVENLLKPYDVLWASLGSFLIAAVIAAILVVDAGLPLLWLVIAGFVAGAGYSIPSVGHKYRALGDLAVFVAFGIGITMGSYYVQARSFAPAPLILAVAFGLLVVAILHANNTRDLNDDEAAGLRTTAVRLGMEGSRIYFASLIAGAYATVIAASIADVFCRGALAALLTAPTAWRLVRDFWRSPVGWQAVVARTVERTAQLSLLFGGAILAGMIGWKLLVGD